MIKVPHACSWHAARVMLFWESLAMNQFSCSGMRMCLMTLSSCLQSCHGPVIWVSFYLCLMFFSVLRCLLLGFPPAFLCYSTVNLHICLASSSCIVCLTAIYHHVLQPFLVREDSQYLPNHHFWLSGGWIWTNARCFSSSGEDSLTWFATCNLRHVRLQMDSEAITRGWDLPFSFPSSFPPLFHRNG